MKNDPDLREAEALTALLRRRKRLLEFGPEDDRRLRAVHDALAAERDGLIDEFYEFLQGDPLVARHLPVGPRLAELKSRQAQYFETLTAGDHGEDYVRGRMETGRVHHRAGIRPDVYLASYRKYVQLALRRLAGRLGEADASYLDAADSLLKIVTLDTQLALDAYTEASRRALSESETRYRALFESSADAILVLEDGVIVDHNPSAPALLGSDRSELLGHAFLALVTTPTTGCSQVNEVGAALETVLSGEPQRVELRVRGAQDEDLYIDAQLNRLEVDGVRLVQAILRDVTARKRAERELIELTATLERRVAERTADLEAANRELEAFTYSVSHDLRAPLRAIDGFSRILEEEHGSSLEGGAGDCLKRLRAAAQRLNRMLSDLLRLSRLALAPLRRQAVDLSAIAREISTDLRALAPREVTFLISPDIVVEGDEGLLRNVMENLLANAWKYTARHERARIEFGRTRSASGEAFFVRDDGAGFDMTNANQLFGVFKRLHRQDEFPGEGVGLATVRRIVLRHRGRVWAEGAVEKGATVYFTLWTETGSAE